jgi:hypothetical protein
VAQRDSAFLWETEALRGVSPHSERADATAPSADGEDWVTLRQASETTGVPVATLRKWALHETVPSYLDETAVGPLRMVSLEGIYRRAEDLGRELKGRPPEAKTSTPEPRKVIDLPPATSHGEPEVPEGTMLVPLDAWTRVLTQLGNLHEAGQQLAEARERAAKAETEAVFLRERLAELRAQLGQTEPPAGAASPPTPPATPQKRSPWSAVRGVWGAIKRPGK